MLVNIIQNTISSFRSALAAASVITTNLKMWLGFETSQHLGLEEVTNGDFSDGFDDWSNGSSWSVANNVATLASSNDATDSTLTSSATLVSAKTYVLTYTISNYVSGELALVNGNVSIPSTNGNKTFTFTGQTELSVKRKGGATALSISNISVKELTQFTPDKSGNNNVGELFTGKALDFDGAGDYVDVSGFSMSGNNATFAFWAYIRDNARADYFFDFQSSTTRFLFGFGQASQELAVYSGGWQDFGNPPQDQWVRIVLTVNGTTAKCFVDGVQLGTDVTISTYDFSSATTAHIGARYTPETNPKWYDGLLSDFQIYNSVWAADDIAYDYANPQNLVTDRDNTTIALSNLKAYWAMSEGAGLLAYDSSGEGNNGTIYGATYEPNQPRIPQLGMMNWAKSTPVADEITLIPNPTIPTQDILGNAVRDRLNSFNLDGSGYAEVADDASINPTTEITVQCWIQSNTETNRGLVAKWNSSVKDYMLLKSGTIFRFYIGTNFLESDTIPTSGWVNIAGTYDGSNIKTYINGVLSTTTALTGSIPNNSQTLDIGRYNSSLGTPYSERISDVLLYDTALDADEIENNYNAGLSAHTN